MSSTAEGFTYEWEFKQYLARVNVPPALGLLWLNKRTLSIEASRPAGQNE